MRLEAVHLVREVVREGRDAYVLVNNRSEGNALLTILNDQLRATPIPCGFQWPYLMYCSLDARVWYQRIGMICGLHACQASRAWLNPDIARNQSKGIDQQWIRFFPS
jgi:hypothetical protein